MREANVAGVRDYLVRVYGLKLDHAAELVNEHREILQDGMIFRSHCDYVGDQIAKAAQITDLYDEAEFEEFEAEVNEADA